MQGNKKEAAKSNGAATNQKPSKPPRIEELEEIFSSFSEYSEEKPTKEEIQLKQFNKEFRQNCFIEAYISTLGNITQARKIVKVDHSTVWRWFHDDESFALRLNSKMLDIEMMLRNKLWSVAMSGNVTALIFALKSVNPFYDDAFRTKVLTGEMAQTLYERYPIPQPNFLPPEVPERFRNAGTNNGTSETSSQGLPSTLVHGGSD